MWFPKSPTHSDYKAVLDFIPRFNRVKDMEEQNWDLKIMHSFILIKTQVLKLTNLIFSEYL